MFQIQEINDHLQNLFNDGNYSEALSYLDELKNIVDLTSDVRVKVNYHIGRIKFYQDEFVEAKYSFIEALKQSHNDLYSIIFLAKILEGEGKLNSSMKLMSKAYEINKNYSQLLYTINTLLEKVPEDDDEIKNFSSADLHSGHQEILNKNPKISILVLCYNKLEYTEKCLKSIFENTSYSNFEVIVIDNASVDDTPGLLESYGSRIKFIRSKKNLGFVEGNNLAAQYATGDYLLFLNNDTEVYPNWLNPLYDTFIYYPNAGAVGSMLLYPDGKLQEAGGVIFDDASGWNYGRNCNPADSKYSFVREVDYCSGAALMVRKDLFFKLGGFDVRYAPAYYEDTDLCFSIRKLGYKIYYCPFSKVIHHEGATAGTDINSGFKKYQITNSAKFKEKWNRELNQQFPNNPDLIFYFSNRKKGKRILIIDDIPPLPDRASGAMRHYNAVLQLLGLGYQITYVHLMGKQYLDESGIKYLTHLKMLGVELIWFNYESWWAIRETPQVNSLLNTLVASLELKLRGFDFVFIAFWHVADYFIDLIRKEITDVPIVIDTLDVHYLREFRRAEILKDNLLFKNADKTKKNELSVYKKADSIITVTENDREILLKDLPHTSIITIPDVHDAHQTKHGFEERKDFLFVGNFNHNPNEDAVLFFLEEIFPLIKKEIKDAKFLIVGNNPTEKVKMLASDDVIVTGWVPEIEPYLEKCRVSVVPLRFGAGMKGKVGQTLSYGLPMVSTTIGSEGMNIINEEHSFITDDPKKFAEYAVKLYLDKNIWEKFSRLGKELINSQFSSKLMKKRFEYLLSFSTREAFKSSKALKFSFLPKVSIVLVTYNQYEYTKKCLDSIRKFTKVSHEVIVVDNASNDGTVKKLQKDFPEVRIIANQENKGFPAAANEGINISLGEYILLLNNDTIVTENWVERMIEVAETDSKIGMVGPISNEVSGLQIDKEAKYSSIEEMHDYAQKVAKNNSGEIFHFPRVAFLCALIKREVVEKIGGLDERFTPGNYEDDDFCLRAQLAGYKTVIAKDVFIHHFGSKSFKADGNQKYIEQLEVNKKKFIDKWGVTPDELWLRNKEIKPRQIIFHINKDQFAQHFERARVQIADKEFAAALNSFILAIQYYKASERKGYEIDYAWLLNLAGNTALLAGNIEVAKNYFEEELSLVPNSSSACVGLGEVFLALEMLENSKVMFEWSVKNDPENKTALVSLSKVNILLGFEEYNNSLN